MTAVSSDRIRARLALVEEHVRRENAHDLPGIMATFGAGAWYDDEPWGEHHEGRDAVHGYYADLLTSLPDLHIDGRLETLLAHPITVAGAYARKLVRPAS